MIKLNYKYYQLLFRFKTIVFLVFIFLFSSSYGQKKGSDAKNNKVLDKKTIFGIQISPIIPANFIDKNSYKFTSDSVDYSINSQTSFSFGAEIRHYFTYRFALNTGIIYTKRNIKTDYSSHYNHDAYGQNGIDTTFSSELRFIAFEIPVKLSGYVRLFKSIFMSISGGIHINFYPSDIYTNNTTMLRYGSTLRKVFQFGFSASLGFEYRTKDSGIFYIGASYQARLNEMAQVQFYEKEVNLNLQPDYFHGINGGYFSIDIKYFFALNEKKSRK